VKDRPSGEPHLEGLKQLRVDRRARRPTVDRGRTWPQRLLLTSGVLATVLCLLSAGVLAWGWSKFSNITQVQLALSAPSGGGPRNWLVVGTDSRDGIDPDDPNAGVFLGEEVIGKRTDTIMVARVDPGAGRIDLLSIPRDLWVPIAGAGHDGRINSAFNGDGGQQRLIDTIEAYFGFEVHHYAEVNFVGFQDLVDSLGGVPLWFDTPMRDDGSGLRVDEAGCHVLDGFQALAFARSRHLEYLEDGQWRSDPTGDLGRISRQQHFVRRVVDRTRSKVNITDLGTIDDVLDVAGRNLVIDHQVGPRDLLGLGRSFASLQGDQIIGHALPVDQHRTTGGAAVLRLRVDEAQPVLDLFRGVVPDPVAASDVVVTVYNGTGVQGQAGAVSEALAAEGFDVAAPQTADQPVGATEIRFEPGLVAQADRLARQLGVRPSLVEDPAVRGVSLVTGPDLGEVRTEPAAFDPEAFAALAPTTVVPSPVTAVPSTPAPGEDADPPAGRVPGPSPEGTACA
jgi:polyisoprenyl-teichoic acid--peptidoglycan teichoic acid transferase